MVALEDLALHLDGRASGRIMYFGDGGCATLDAERQQLQQFVKATKLRGIFGFLEDVDWIESVAFEILLIEALARCKRVDDVDAWIKKNYAGLRCRLRFNLIW